MRLHHAVRGMRIREDSPYQLKQTLKQKLVSICTTCFNFKIPYTLPIDYIHMDPVRFVEQIINTSLKQYQPIGPTQCIPEALSPVVKRPVSEAITHLHLLPKLRMVELYLYSSIRLHVLVLNYLSTGKTLPFILVIKTQCISCELHF
jgi:hypothetical protein